MAIFSCRGFWFRIHEQTTHGLDFCSPLSGSARAARVVGFRERWLEDPALGSQGRTVFFSVLEQPLPPLLPPGRRGLVVLKCGRLVKSEFSWQGSVFFLSRG